MLDYLYQSSKEEYHAAFTEQALRKTLNIIAWDEGTLIGSARLLSDDGYFFTAVPEVLVHPKYQKRGIGRRASTKRKPRRK